jgi:hypothetical protein
MLRSAECGKKESPQRSREFVEEVVGNIFILLPSAMVSQNTNTVKLERLKNRHFLNDTKRL